MKETIVFYNKIIKFIFFHKYVWIISYNPKNKEYYYYNQC